MDKRPLDVEASEDTWEQFCETSLQTSLQDPILPIWWIFPVRGIATKEIKFYLFRLPNGIWQSPTCNIFNAKTNAKLLKLNNATRWKTGVRTEDKQLCWKVKLLISRALLAEYCRAQCLSYFVFILPINDLELGISVEVFTFTDLSTIERGMLNENNCEII